MKSVKIRALGGGEPHENWGSWKGFLKSCEVRDKHDGVVFYGKTNCNYIVFPDGMLVRNYGYHGWALMNRIREEGVKVVKADLVKQWQELDKTLAKLRVST